jgi:hypothetical protein
MKTHLLPLASFVVVALGLAGCASHPPPAPIPASAIQSEPPPGVTESQPPPSPDGFVFVEKERKEPPKYNESEPATAIKPEQSARPK